MPKLLIKLIFIFTIIQSKISLPCPHQQNILDSLFLAKHHRILLFQILYFLQPSKKLWSLFPKGEVQPALYPLGLQNHFPVHCHHLLWVPACPMQQTLHSLHRTEKAASLDRPHQWNLGHDLLPRFERCF